MCSILGYLGTTLTQEHVEALNARLAHRGPDASAVRDYRMGGVPLYFGHNRLAIQDLDPTANQPQENDAYVIVFNGEVYNHFDIRAELTHTQFRTTSDTETILWAFTEWGLGAVERFIGMFAIALFDKRTHTLHLLRDRVGIKPLYYTHAGGEFAFASTPKGLPEYLKGPMDPTACVQFMALGAPAHTRAWHQGVHKVAPGHILRFDGTTTATRPYWSPPTEHLNLSFDEAVERAESLLSDSIRLRLLADVEVGAFLSGGVDSSLVSALMAKHASRRIKTFSIGFHEARFDESPYAEAVARHIGSDHHTFHFTAGDVLDLVEGFDEHYDEPFGDASALPMMLLSAKTREHVTVALSGDGGDELFLGYERYFLTQKYHTLFSRIPAPLRAPLAFLCRRSGRDRLEKIAHPLANLSRFTLYAVLTTSVKPWELHRLFRPDFLKSAFPETPDYLALQALSGPPAGDALESFSRIDLARYLPDDILTKVDRASMHCALEARVPLLDHRLVEFAYALPSGLKLRNGPKSILKTLLYRHLPESLFDRKKAGFSVPLELWFRNELRPLLEAKVERLDDSVFDTAHIRTLVDLHVNQGRNYSYLFWNLMRLPERALP